MASTSEPKRSDPDRLMTVDEVAAYIGLPKATLYRYRSFGGGPRASKLGKWLRYRKSDVDAWVDSKADDWTEDVPARRS